MTVHDHTTERRPQDTREPGAACSLSKGYWVFLVLAVIGGALLLSEHRAHVLGALPYLFLLACPLMHIFMHGGHGHRHGGGNDDAAK